MITLFRFLTIFLFLLLHQACQEQSHQPRLKLEQGKIYYQNSKLQNTIMQESDGTRQEVTLNSESRMAFYIKEIKKETYVAEAHYKKMSLKMDTPDGMMSFDSENKGTDPVSNFLAEMLGQAFEVKFSKKGEIQSIKGLQSLIDKKLRNFSGMNLEQKSQIRAQIEETFGPLAIKDQLQNHTAIFPDKQVKIGESWPIEKTVFLGVLSNVEMTYALNEVKENEYILEGKGKLVADSNASTDSKIGQMVYHLDGNVTADLSIHRASGWIVKADIKQNFTGTVEVTEATQFPEGISVPMQMNSKVTITN